MREELKPCPFCGWDANAEPESQHMPGCYFEVLDRLKAAPKSDLSLVPAMIKAWNRRAQPAEAEGVLADRMRAADMLTIEEMLAGAPLDRFIKHAGVNDLETYGQWLDMECRKFLAMQAKRDLNKDPEDDMYEWVLAHAAVFQAARINFKAARDAHLAALSAVTAERDGLAAARMAYANEFAPDENGDPDVGNVHANIRALKAERDRLRSKWARVESERDQLRAKVEMLREDAERWRYVSLQGDDMHWLNLLRVDLDDFGGNINAAVDALIDGEAPAMAAKEA